MLVGWGGGGGLRFGEAITGFGAVRGQGPDTGGIGMSQVSTVKGLGFRV